MTPKILVVDDSPAERESIAAMLRTSGRYEVETAGSGEEALGRIERGPVDLLVTDFVMPGLDGLQVVNRAIELVPSLRGRVLVVTGGMLGREDALAFALRTTVISKPFTRDQLLGTVEALLAGAISKGP